MCSAKEVCTADFMVIIEFLACASVSTNALRIAHTGGTILNILNGVFEGVSL
jgi:hypothetical protein